MLRALKHLLRPGGRIAYTTIHVAPGLEPNERRRAQRVGPRAVASRSSQRQLLLSAGFVDVEVLDVTPEFGPTARAWLDGLSANADVLAPREPPGQFDQRQRERRAQLRAIEDGLLRRSLLSATRP